jgi:hypothetical protein
VLVLCFEVISSQQSVAMTSPHTDADVSADGDVNAGDANLFTFECLAEMLQNDQNIKAIKAREGHKKVVRRLKKWMIVQKAVAGDAKPLPAAARVDAVRRVVKQAHEIIDNETLHTPRTPSPLRSRHWSSPRVETRRHSLPLPQFYSPPPSPQRPLIATNIYKPSIQEAAHRAAQRVRANTLRNSTGQRDDNSFHVDIGVVPRDEYMKLQRTTSHMALKARHEYERAWLDNWHKENSPKSKVIG